MVLDRIAAVEDEGLQLTLGRAAVTLAGLRLDSGTIDQTWKESAMPIPSILDQRFEEGREQGLEQGLERGLERGLEQGLEQMTATLLRARFGTDVAVDHVDAMVRRLVPLGAEAIVARIEAATSLDDLP